MMLAGVAAGHEPVVDASLLIVVLYPAEDGYDEAVVVKHLEALFGMVVIGDKTGGPSQPERVDAASEHGDAANVVVAGNAEGVELAPVVASAVGNAYGAEIGEWVGIMAVTAEAATGNVAPVDVVACKVGFGVALDVPVTEAELGDTTVNVAGLG